MSKYQEYYAFTRPHITSGVSHKARVFIGFVLDLKSVTEKQIYTDMCHEVRLPG